MKRLTKVGICLILFLASAGGAWAFSYEFGFDQKAVQATSDQYGDLLKLEGCNMHGAPGEPFVPVKIGHIAAPFGSQVTDIKVVDERWVLLPGNYDIRPAPTPIPISYDGPMPEVVRNTAIYSSDKPYPTKAFIFTGGGMMRGYSLGGFQIFPLRYYPASGRIEILEKLVVQVEYTASHSPFNPTVEFGTIISRLVENPSDVQNQPFILSPVDPDDVKYLIITSTSLVPSFQPLADWYTQSGWPAEIITYTYIQNNYSGATNQLKIKACVQDYAVNKGTIFVLLGGDDTIIPDQNCWGDVNNGGTTDNTIPTDLFYACHDSTFNWNLDGDNRVGEYNDGIDLYPEVFISRAPVRSTLHTTNFVNKTLNYIKNQPASGFVDPMLLSGVELWQTWGGRSDADWRCERLWNDYVSPIWSGHSRLRFYDTNTDFGGPGHDVTWQNLRDKFNDGYKYFFMATHGGQTTWGMETGSSFSSSHASALTNSNEEGVIYTIACNTNAFEQELYSNDPCLSEGFIRNGSGGAVVYQGCSRYGWGWNQQSDEHGPSFQYADEFYYYLFTGNSTGVPSGYHYRMGAVAASHKAAKVPECFSEGASSVMRWINYGTNSIGDPGMDLFTEDPLTMNPSYDEAVPIGNSDFTITSLPDGARVCLWKGSEVYAVGMESSGSLTLSINPTSTGVMYITITAHNSWPHIDSVDVISSGPYVTYDFHTTNDSSGNNDGLVNNGESIILGVQLKNPGSEDARNVTATLSTVDSFVTITDNFESYGTISGNGGTAYRADAFAFDVAGNIPDSHSIQFELTVTGTALDTWISYFSITAHAPIVEYLSVTVNDASGNNNGILDPGEVADLIVTLENIGSAQASSVTGILSESDPYVIIIDNYGSFGDIAPDGGIGDNSSDVFVVSADGSCPMGYQMTFDLLVSAGGVYSASLSFDLIIGDKMVIFSDDFSFNQGWTGLGGNGEWTIGPATGGSGSDSYGGPDPSVDHSPSDDNQVLGNDLNPGTGGDYNANLSTTYWVTSPVIDCYDYTEVTLTFYRWLGVERDLYDHAYLQVHNGSSWITLFENSSTTVDESSWNEQVYDVSAMADSNSSFQIRFGIGETDYAWQYCGWNIDDLTLEGYLHIIAENPVISLLPTSIYDSLSPGHQGIHYVTVYNTGMATLDVTFSSVQSWIYFNGGPYYIDPQDSLIFDVSLSTDGLVPGNHAGSIDFSCNDPVTPNGNIPVNLYVYNPNISANPTAITDTLIENQSTTRYIILQNTGEGVLDYTVTFETFSLVSLDNGTLPSKKAENGLISPNILNKDAGKNFEGVESVIDDLMRDITDDWLNVTPLAGSINAGEIDSLEVTLDATGQNPGTYTGQISIASNDYDTPNIDIPVTMVVEELQVPDISFSPTSITDSLSQYSQSIHYITIYNTGNATLSVTFSTNELWIQFDGGPYYVEPEDSATLQVTLDATDLPPGDYSGSVDFSSNDPDTPSGNIPVSLHIFAPDISFSPTAISDSLHEDSLSVHDIMIYNTGMGILLVSFSTNEPWIQFDGGPYYVDPEDSATLQVTLDATDLPPGDYSGSIDFSSNDPDTPSGNIPVSLHIFEPDISVDPTAVNDTLEQGQQSIYYIYIENNGPGWLNYIVSYQTINLLSPGDSHVLPVKTDNINKSLQPINEITGADSNSKIQTGTEPINLPATLDRNMHVVYNAEHTSDNMVFELLMPTWLTVFPLEGSVEPGGKDTLEVTLDATDLDEGEYSSEITITSNDPDSPNINIPVSLVVEILQVAIIELNVEAIYDTVFSGSSSDFELLITNIGTLDLQYNVIDDQLWIEEDPDSGVVAPSTTDTVTITFDASSLDPGTYNGTVTVNSNDANQPQIDIPVELEVIVPQIPNIQLSTYSFNDTVGGGDILIRELIISNTGNGTLNYTLSDDCDWLSENPDSGQIDPGGQQDTIDIIFDATNLYPGTYDGTITVNSNDPDSGTIDIPVLLYVFLPGGCDYLPGDVNSDGSVMGNDVTFSVLYFKGTGLPPPDSCWDDSLSSWLYAAGDVNGNCQFTGSDVTFLVSYFKGFNPELFYCHRTPPAYPPLFLRNSEDITPTIIIKD